MYKPFSSHMGTEVLLLQASLGAISVIANMLSAFAGGGAGLVQLPALIFLGLPYPIALGTHKIASVALGLGAGLRHAQEGSLKKILIFITLGFGVPGVCLGSKVVLSIPSNLATAGLGILTLAIGIYSSNRPSLGTTDQIKNINTSGLIIGGFILFWIGFLNGSLASGTGLLATLWLVQWFGISYTKAIAHTLILVGLIWNGTGALILGINGEIQWGWIPMLIGGSLTGGYLGANLSLQKGTKIVKKAFEILSISMGLSLIIKSFY